MKAKINWEDFIKLDIRMGTVLSAKEFPRAKKPAYQLTIDFGEAGVLNSSAQITDLYTPEILIGQQVAAIINLPEKQIANFFSQCLVLGVYNTEGKVILLQPEREVPNGTAVS